jgi:hypothetical protein
MIADTDNASIATIPKNPDDVDSEAEDRSSKPSRTRCRLMARRN